MDPDRPTPIYVFREEEARKVLPWLILAWVIIILAGVVMLDLVA